MSQPMQFPKPGRFLLWAVLLVFAVGLPAALWLTWRLDPVQSFYFGPYLLSAMEGGTSDATVPVRYAIKTAPGRVAAPLVPGDAERGASASQPLILSPNALAMGWRGVTVSPSRKVRPFELESYLRTTVFGGDSVWWLLGEPVIVLLAIVLIPSLVVKVFRSGSRGSREHEQRHGRRTKGPELASGLLLFRRSKDAGLRLQMARRGLFPGGSFRIPKRLESSHILILGDTGSGKSSAIRQILRQVEERGETAIVNDPAMDFIGEFYNEERGDLILNPLDARCPYWSVGDEIDYEETAATIAAAMLPEKEYEKPYFTEAPRRILAHLLRNKPQPRDLLCWMSDPAQIEAMVQATPLAAYLDPGAPQQRAGILSSMNMIADALELLPEWEPTRPTFSTGEWKSKRSRWVFLTSSAAYRGKVLPLHSAWLDLLILRMMGYCEDQAAKPVWFVLDELASLNKLPQLHTAVTENRKYGNPVVIGMQGKSQMEKRYGQDAEAMLSQPATKIFLKTSEPRAAKWVSDAIGEIEVERLKESRSMALLGAKKSYAMEVATKPLVMASEIAGLAPLHGFIKQENRVVPAHFRLAKKRKGQPEFVERTREMPAPRKPVEEPISAPVQKSLTPEPVQAELPLDKAPEVEEEGFTWDSSKEIE